MTPWSDSIRDLLLAARRIAVVGLSSDPSRPSHWVSEYMQGAGYEIVPVHPDGGTVLGEAVHRDLPAAGASGSIDIVNVFRRSEHIPALVDDIIAVQPRLVWLQAGIRNDDAAARIEAAGIPVVQDRCIMVDHRRSSR
ncbi:MAG: CoA-binding protein [Gemmatimonadota bacterium]|nr:CoA-binding protein [Gemmatimonadota bacterium]